MEVGDENTWFTECLQKYKNYTNNINYIKIQTQTGQLTDYKEIH